MTRRADNPEWVSSKSNTGAEWSVWFLLVVVIVSLSLQMTRRVESNRLKLFDSKSNTERVVIQIRGAQRTCMTNDISFSIW